MAIKNDYSAGTVSVSAGGTVVTGVSSMWVAADIQPGDTFKVKNLDAIILSVDSNTQITLQEAWTGGALAASAYAIRYQPDGSRYSAAARALIEMLGNGNLQAFAGLTGAINKFPYFIGAGAMALADFKDWAVSFFSLTPAANKLAYFNGSTTAALTDLTAAGRASLNITGTPAADKLPYLTGSSGAALADLTTAGRALLDDADASAQLTTLGVSTYAKTLLDDANAGAAQTTLGISTFAKSILDDTTGAAMFATMGGVASGGGAGSQTLPSGVVIKWGTVVVTTNATGTATVLFATAFPGACWACTAVDASVSTGRYLSLLGAASPSGFNAQSPILGGGIAVSYIALGN
ncbi:gp53-like domain-containing protein [Phyllobacterium bourgognense]|uniref:Putative tail fiber protein gp53-like C-terminal domain-containing protein n=1 Tax=Phyllobacterium bourgognense TaxID=314236 RepID=A0A368YL19_9HYPH|nr:hypothetical protein [Phyllobacterium bourgognense]RCW80933.1 hypothetical protein C7476_11289 [Phyllobacterium bourgognense]